MSRLDLRASGGAGIERTLLAEEHDTVSDGQQLLHVGYRTAGAIAKGDIDLARHGAYIWRIIFLEIVASVQYFSAISMLLRLKFRCHNRSGTVLQMQ